jgi:hypothetical protein
MESVHISTKAMSSNPTHGEVYSIQHYVIKFVSDLRQVGGSHKIIIQLEKEAHFDQIIW